MTGPFPPDVPAPAVADAELVERITDSVVDRLRGSLGFPPEEPPVAPLDVDDPQFGAAHLAGAFMHEPEESVAAPSPAGAFADAEPLVAETSAPHPAGAFTAED